MNMLDVLTGNFLEGTSDDCMSQNVIQLIGIIDILRLLAYAKHGNLFRQMGSRKERIASFVRWNGFSKIQISAFLQSRFFVFLPSIKVIYRLGPRHHVVGVVVQHFELWRKLTDVVAGSCAGHQEFELAAAEAAQCSLCSAAVRVAHLVAFIKAERNLLIVHANPLLDLLAILTQHIKCHEHKVTLLNIIQIRRAGQHDVRFAVVLHSNFPCILNRDSWRNHPCAEGILFLHTVCANCNTGKRLAAALLPLDQSISFLDQTVDILLLQVCQVDVFIILCIVKNKVIQPFSNMGFRGHFRERLHFSLVAALLATQHLRKYAVVLRRPVISNNTRNRDHLFLALREFASHLRTVCTISQTAVTLDKFDFVLIFRFVLSADNLPQICEHLCLGDAYPAPLLI